METTPQSQPEPWAELLAGYVLGDLTPAELVLVEEYLAQHPEQQAEVASLMLPLDLLPLSLPADLPPASLRQQIMQIAEGEVVANRTPIRQPEIKSSSWRAWQTAITGIGLLICAGLGWQNYQLNQELATIKQDLTNTKIAQSQQSDRLTGNYKSIVNILQQPNNRFLALKSMGKKPMGVGSLVMAPQKSSALLTLQQVSPLPTGQVYRIWAILDDGEMACGDFLPDVEGKVLMQVPLKSWAKVSKVTITIEDKTAVEPEGEIAIEGEIHI